MLLSKSETISTKNLNKAFPGRWKGDSKIHMWGGKSQNMPNEEEKVDIKAYYKSIAIRAVCIHVGLDKNTNETE